MCTGACLASPHRPLLVSGSCPRPAAVPGRTGYRSMSATRRWRDVEMIRMIAAVRATVTAVTLLAGVPILLVTLGGSPVPDRAPSAAQLQTWLDDPLRPQYG